MRAWNSLNFRERRTLLLGGLVLLVAVVVNFIFLPVLDEVGSLETRVANKQVLRDEIGRLVARLDSQGQAAAASGGEQGQRINGLLPWLERLINKGKLTDKLVQIVPLSSNRDKGLRERANIRLEGMSAERALWLIHSIESAPGMLIARGDLRRQADEKQGLSVNLELALY